ncbi:MAG: GIY-YIG nuclease family protein [Planctomycetes bacterium]|nr:GIY-YIG nuclease family protein [Planctomycetota bacterium]MCK4981111.1 GIY-YIG nuclease family protein [Candidatus Delongbacteria bacterium]MCK5579199.1 GIY-YIG nuclease family protein [Planctomycetota bacterium]
MEEKRYCIYIMTNKRNSVLYTGVTSNLKKRIYDHKKKIVEGFTKKYNVNKLVYYEIFNEVQSAIKREKQIKAGSRNKKNELIEKLNPKWNDLYYGIL